MAVARYLWRFFVGDLFQLLALAAVFLVVALLARPLGPWDGALACLLVAAVVWADVLRRAVPRGRPR
jgi:hypothetical protein